jgi:plastocyanin
MKWFIFFLLVCLPIVSAVEFFPYYDSTTFNAPLLFDQKEVEFKLVEFFPSFFVELQDEIINYDNLGVKKVIISDQGINPQRVVVQVDESVVFKNEREKWSARLVGMREISEMNSDFLEPNSEYTFSFSEPGEYVYVDTIIIGITGKIVVK